MFPVVGLGASAGGLAALRAFVAALPPAPGVAFVIVQHLDPDRETLVPHLLQSHTRLPVQAIVDGEAVAPDRVYVVPSNATAALDAGTFRLDSTPTPRDRRAAIDLFFRSLARDRAEFAIGAVLSGAGADGTLGLRAIRERGGLTLAQSEATAAEGGMARHAIEQGVVDHVLTPEEMAREVVRFARRLSTSSLRLDRRLEPEALADFIRRVCAVLQNATGHDFLHYRHSTLGRRIQRRMQILHVDDPEAYLTRLESDPREVEALFRDLLIGVTRFFRDPEIFDAIERSVIPSLLRDRSPENPIRVWVPGCASGEEAYSLAILFREAIEDAVAPPAVQIFATDIDDDALRVARRGWYPKSIEQAVSRARLTRFFTREDDGYAARRELRELCLFSMHNLIRDPPFSRLDLISCRNVLIYLGPHLQKKLIPVFQYALKPQGYLVLGPGENVLRDQDLFSPMEGQRRIWQRRPSPADPPARPAGGPTFGHRTASPPATPRGEAEEPDLGRIAQGVILEEFAPAHAVVNRHREIQHLSAGASSYLEMPAGRPTTDLLQLVRRDLRVGLRSALRNALRERRRARVDDCTVGSGERRRRVSITAQPMPALGEEDGLVLVVFQERGLVPESARGQPPAEPEAHPLIEQLEAELISTRRDLELTIQDLEASNEELKSSNEELLSMNEELQSANEELETSKEEVQAANDALARANTDLENLLASTGIAVIFLDEKGRLKAFTPAVGEIYNLIDADVGRPVSHITHRFVDAPSLPGAEAVERAGRVEHELRTDDGRWFIRRTLPYRNRDGRTDGLVVTFTDVTALKEIQEALQQSETRFRVALQNSPITVFNCDREGRFTWIANAHPDYPAERIIGRREIDVLGPDAGRAIAEARERVVRSGQGERAEVTLVTSLGEQSWDLTIEPVRGPEGEVVGLTVAALEVTERKRAEETVRRSESEYRATFEVAGVGKAEIDPSTFRFLRVNRKLAEITGYSRSELTEITARHLVHPDDRAAELAGYERLVAGETAVHQTECRYRRKDGSTIWMHGTITAIRNDENRPVRLISVFHDVTERREVEAHQRVLLAELNHRVKNTLMTVLAIASQTLQRAKDLESFGTTFEGRLRALARAHNLMLKSDWKQTSLERLVRDATGPFCRPSERAGETGIHVEGPAVQIKPKAALALSMVLHELCTNASKYGALSRPGGRVLVEWRLGRERDAEHDGTDGGEEPRLLMVWTERDGPPVAPPEQLGFGTNLIRSMTQYELGGDARIEFRDSGLRAELSVPWTAEPGRPGP